MRASVQCNVPSSKAPNRDGIIQEMDGGVSGRSPYLWCEKEHDQRRHSEARDQ